MDAILDATAALIVEEGVAAVTMHRVARRSGTTTGSMYHFFPDRETLLAALAERHARELRALVTRIEHDAAHWARLSTAEAVGRFLDPFLTYSDEHPDLLPLARLARTTAWGVHRDVELGRLVVRLAEDVVASRCPGIPPAARTLRAVTMTAMMDGMGSALAHAPDAPADGPSVAALRQELRRALVAYLDSDAAAAAPERPASCGSRHAGRSARD